MESKTHGGTPNMQATSNINLVEYPRLFLRYLIDIFD